MNRSVSCRSHLWDRVVSDAIRRVSGPADMPVICAVDYVMVPEEEMKSCA